MPPHVSQHVEDASNHMAPLVKFRQPEETDVKTPSQEDAAHKWPDPIPTYHPVNGWHAHPARKRDILAAHPEIKQLIGKWLAALLVTANLTIAAAAGLNWERIPWLALLAVVYLVGTPINHACAMIIHETAHDLAAVSVTANHAIALLANLPLAVPAAMSFRCYHLLHHSHLGVIGRDLDLPTLQELMAVGCSTCKKMLWHSLYMFSYGLRPLGWGVKQVSIKGEALNAALQIAFDVAMALAFGAPAVAYMFACTLFAFGMHPCAAHFLQEHYTIRVGVQQLQPQQQVQHQAQHQLQETFSYYGPLNPLILNLAPHFYDNLVYHTSVWEVMLEFYRRSDLGPASRVTRTMSQYQVSHGGKS
ncbi:hypothetical protein JKP88DRAFT_258625 [Tribonema minus]|uniref:Fatty acid desaturase domain-containing protein n=1 Tax=Tribonema minus TaxID=303371 RepID=A0A836CAB0_9STRA|nr:hypothetical protein JKP88DRAFT_258625 [Tribonema minus]